MWGRKDQEPFDDDAPPVVHREAPMSAPTEARPTSPPPSQGKRAGASRFGRSVKVKGEIHCDEDLFIDGIVEGVINIATNELVIGANSKVNADVNCRSLILHGSLQGKVNIAERIEIKKSGCLEGSLVTQWIVIEDGGIFRGSSSIHAPKKPAPTVPTKPVQAADPAKRAAVPQRSAQPAVRPASPAPSQPGKA